MLQEMERVSDMVNRVLEDVPTALVGILAHTNRTSDHKRTSIYVFEDSEALRPVVGSIGK